MNEHLSAIGLKKQYQTLMKPCEVCDGEQFLLVQQRGRIAEAGTYGDVPVQACYRCGFVMQNPRYEDQFYLDYYDRLYRETTFGHAEPSQIEIEDQHIRSTEVMNYLNRFIDSPGRMLDHGCGMGATMLPFREAGWHVVGIDPHRPSVEVGRKQFELDIKLGCGEDLPFEKNVFDLVYSLGSTEHSYDLGSTMKEVRRVLVPGGWFLIRWRSNMIWGSPLEYYNHNHYRFFTPKTLRLLLCRYGFSIVDTTDHEYEDKPGGVYMLARKDLEPSLQAVHGAIEQGQCENAEKIHKELIQTRIQFAEKCERFLQYCESVDNDWDEIVRAVRTNELNYRLLLEPKRTVENSVNRGKLEAHRYLEEFNNANVY